MEKGIKCYADMRYGFNYVHSCDNPPPPDGAFELHSHSGYEILIVLKGTSEFVVEGTVYSLEPADIVIIRSNNMHRVLNIQGDEYERIVINIESTFFEDNGCTQYDEIFRRHTKGDGNLLRGSGAHKNEIFSNIKRLEDYINRNKDENLTVVRCVFIELMHRLSELKISDRGEVRNETVRGVISYINENLGEPLKIDDLSEHFYISKYHLCRIFKEYTGVTLKHYITCKRLLAVRNMYDDGKSLCSAAFEAGFASYSAFYKAYIKENGCSPSFERRERSIL